MKNKPDPQYLELYHYTPLYTGVSYPMIVNRTPSSGGLIVGQHFAAYSDKIKIASVSYMSLMLFAERVDIYE